MRRWLALAAAVSLCAATAAADGGRLRLRRDVGPFAVTVFTAPEPLTAGPADVSVLVQDLGSGEVVLDAEVAMRLTGPGATGTRTVTASPAANRLLKAAHVVLPTPGAWSLEVIVRRAGATANVSCALPVGSPVSGLLAIWPFLAVPPLGVALFVLHGALRRRVR